MKPDEPIPAKDRAILLKEELVPGSLWKADYSDILMLTVPQDCPDKRWPVHDCFRVRGDMSPHTWKDLEKLSKAAQVGKRLGAAVVSQDFINDLLRWKLIQKDSWVMLIDRSPLPGRTSWDKLTWWSSFQMTLLYNDQLMTTMAVNLDIWYDLFTKKEG